MVSSKATSVTQYLKELPAERREVVAAVRELVNRHVPKGFEEVMQYGMIAWIVPFSRFPKTYNGQPLAALALAAQKNNFALYSMGAYGDPATRQAFVAAYAKAGMKLDMGGSCIRFRTLEALLQPAVAKLVAAVSVDDMIAAHEASHGAGAKAKRAAARGAGAAKQPAVAKQRAAKRAPAKSAKKVAKKRPAR